MQVFEDIVKDGMTGGEVFKQHLSKFVYLQQITRVIETGTYKGQGTTLAIMDGFDRTLDCKLVTIEVNPEYHRIASDYWNGNSRIVLMKGLSIPRSQVPVDTTFNVPDWVIVDHQPTVRRRNYHRELTHPVPDRMLADALHIFDHKPDLVLLDSAGHIGRIEFLYLMELVGHHQFYLALDDTDHVKHYETMQLILSMPEKFEVIWQIPSRYVDPENGDGAGSTIIKVK